MRLLTYVLLIIATVSVAYTLFNAGIQASKDTEIPEVSLEGYVKADVAIADNILTFKTDCYELPMTIHEVQAMSIKGGLENKIEARPLTHDIMRDMIEAFGIKINMVRIESFNDGIYYARIFMKQGNKALDVDARPTDATGIAVRLNVPIYFNQELLEKYGTKIC